MTIQPILLDTNAFIRMIQSPELLTPKAQKAIQILELIVSIASPWEMTIKVSLGKLHLRYSVQEILDRHSHIISLLPIEPKHLATLVTLPHHHRDPFDRIIISQAIAENIPIVSSDAAFDGYGVRRIWE